MSSLFNAINWVDVFRMESGIGVTIVAADGRVAYSNEAARALFGVEPAKTPGQRNLSALFHPEFVRERLAWIQQVIKEGKPLRARHIYNGQQMASTFYPIQDGGDLLQQTATPTSGDEDHSDDNLREAGEDKVSADAIVEHYALIISRRDADVDSQDIETVTSQYVDLGCLSALSNRELEIFVLLGHGNSVPGVAKMLHRSPRTIERHKTEIGRKLGYSTLAEIARAVGHLGLTYDHVQLERFHALAKDRKQE
ncbi:Bacterial regulatory protein, luxR family [Novipirellula galeiformis]|uniref:Bacterial regulatory protein, luxR family n=1 Tax=Novipirellula galeiformis TaxID=2528004 RepID=A0A5C6CEM5_9BACT|nr:LuxR C-terminal-related transcriptional regulator [Novipirellula galeiformis]TWU23060.1 Bacterial regulatory protein, luxR family [Novipirellula galeiformis]